MNAKDRKAMNPGDRYENPTETGGVLMQLKTNINRHKMAVAQRVHVLQHVTFIKYSIFQMQLPKKTAVVIISYGQVVPAKHKNTNTTKHL